MRLPGTPRFGPRNEAGICKSTSRIYQALVLLVRFSEAGFSNSTMEVLFIDGQWAEYGKRSCCWSDFQTPGFADSMEDTFER